MGLFLLSTGIVAHTLHILVPIAWQTERLSEFPPFMFPLQIHKSTKMESGERQMIGDSIFHTEKNRYTVLPIQYLRGVAAVMVVWHHTRGQISSFEPFLPLEFGALGVDLFFVISGFIMQITTANSAIRPLEFMLRRVIRVAPLYWMLTGLMVFAWFLAPNFFKTLVVTPETLFKSVFFIPHFSNSFPDKIYPLLVPGWTLNYEMFFYSIFSFSLMLLAKIRVKVLSMFMVTLVCIGSFCRPFATAPIITYTSPLLLEFVAGVLIGQFWLLRRQTIGFATGLCLFATGWGILIGSSLLDASRYLTIIGATFVVFGSINSVFMEFRNRGLQILGDSTYSIYLTHIFSLGILRVIWIKFMGDADGYLSATAFALLAMLICIFIGIITYFYLEKPITQYLNRKLVFPRKLSVS